MSKLPRVLPLLAIAVGGVLAVRAVDGAVGLPGAFAGARAWAEEVVPKAKAKAETAQSKDANLLPPGSTVASPPPSLPTVQACGASAAELANFQHSGIRSLEFT